MVLRRSNDKPLKDAIAEMLAVFGLDEKYRKQKIILTWDSLMGPSIARRTTKIYFSGRKLFVHLDSAPLRQELMMSQYKVVALLNEAAGADIIEQVIFT